MQFRLISLCCLVVGAGCAGAPASAPAPETHQVALDGSNVEAAERAGYKLVNRNGEQVYCRTDPITGSRIETQTTCLTSRELALQMESTRQRMQQTQVQSPAPYGK
jgi:hypothetical protein